MKFKAGDKVIVKDVRGWTDVTEGKGYTVTGIDDSGRVVFYDDVGDRRVRNADEFLPVTKTLSDLGVGDIVIDDCADERFVMAVYGKMVTLSDDEDEAEGYDCCSEHTVKEMENAGFKVKQETTDETIEIEGKKYSVKEIKEKLNK